MKALAFFIAVVLALAVNIGLHSIGGVFWGILAYLGATYVLPNFGMDAVTMEWWRWWLGGTILSFVFGVFSRIGSKD